MTGVTGGPDGTGRRIASGLRGGDGPIPMMQGNHAPPRLRAHVIGLAVGSLLAPVLLFAGLLLLVGEDEGAWGFDPFGFALAVFVTGAVIALPLSLIVERVWPTPRCWWEAMPAYVVLGAVYAVSAEAALLGTVSLRLVVLGSATAVIARAAGGRFAHPRQQRGATGQTVSKP